MPEAPPAQVCFHCKDETDDMAGHLRLCQKALVSAQELLASRNDERLRACQEELQGVLEKYGARLVTSPVNVSIALD